MSKKNFKIGNLFYDNRFLMVFSVFAAIIIWAIVAAEFSPETEKTIENVPVNIQITGLSESNGLKAYYDAEYTVDVVVRGKRYIVDSADDVRDDLNVSANTSFISTAGTHTLNLEVSSKSISPQYEIVSVSYDEISVLFDVDSKKDFKIYTDFKTEGGAPIAAEGYREGDATFSGGFDTVTVYGPKTQINKIDRICAEASVEGNFSKNTIIDANLVALDSHGNAISNFIEFSRDTLVKVNLPIYKISDAELTVSFEHAPSAYVGEGAELPFKVTVAPSVSKVALKEDLAAGDLLSVKTISYSEIKAGQNAFTVDPAEINNALFENSDEQITIRIDASLMVQKTVTALSSNERDFAYGNNAYAKNADIEFVDYNFEKIELVGSAASLNEITEENIKFVIDVSGIKDGDVGSFKVPVRVLDDDCWSYGEYTATVIVG